MPDLINAIDLLKAGLISLLMISGVVERVTELIIHYIEFVSKKKFKIQYGQAISVAVSLIICFATGVKLIEYPQLNIYVNYILAAAVCSLGSNFIHDLLKLIINTKEYLKEIKITK